MSEENQPVEEAIEQPVQEVEATETIEETQQETVGEQPEAESEEQSTEEVAETPEHNRTGYDKRQAFKAQKVEMERIMKENEYLKGQAQQYQQPIQRQEPAQAEKHIDPNAPDIANYSDTNEYMRDAVQYETHRQVAASDAQRQQNQAKQTFIDQCDEYAKSNPTFRDDMTYNQTNISPMLESEILNSSAGAKIAHAIAKDPALANKLNGMDQRSLIREIARMEVVEVKKPTLSSASPPPSSPKSSSPKTVTQIGNVTSFEEHAAIMNKLNYG